MVSPGSKRPLSSLTLTAAWCGSCSSTTVQPRAATHSRNVASSDFHLAGSSPARNAGSNGLVTFDFFDLDGNGVALEPTPVDLDATRRIANGTVDMGCYEVRPGK